MNASVARRTCSTVAVDPARARVSIRTLASVVVVVDIIRAALSRAAPTNQRTNEPNETKRTTDALE